jgi:hypothetical protein
MAGLVQANEAALVDIAGSQRMLTQNILKVYCQIGMDESYGNPQRQLEEAIRRFDAQVATIKAGSKDAKVEAALGEVTRLWPPYQKLATATPSKEGAAMLLALNPALLSATHAVVVALEQSSGTTAGEIVNLSGRQRMLTQRMAMLYMLQIWGIDDVSIDPELKKATEEFRAAQIRLSALPANTPRITSGLMRVHRSIDMLQRAMGYKAHNLSFTVATTTDRMLDAMNKVTAEYAAILGSASR